MHINNRNDLWCLCVLITHFLRFCSASLDEVLKLLAQSSLRGRTIYSLISLINFAAFWRWWKCVDALVFVVFLHNCTSSQHPPLCRSTATTRQQLGRESSCAFTWTYMLKYASKPLTVKRSGASSFIDAHQTPLQFSYTVLAYHNFLAVEPWKEMM